MHGWFCANFPTIFAAHALDARKAGTPPPPRQLALAEMLQSPLGPSPLEFSARHRQWIDAARRTGFPDIDGIPVLIAADAKPLPA